MFPFSEGFLVPPPDTQWQDSFKIAFTLWGFPVAWYSIFVFLGFMVAIFFGCMKLWKVYKVSTEPFYWFILLGVPGAIMGARLWSCAIGDASWSAFWQFSNGGLAIQGGVMLDALIAMIYFPLILRLPSYRVRDELGSEPTVRKVSMWMYIDAIIPTILIAHFLGRWGNYFNQEVYGSLIVQNSGLAQFLHDHLPFMYVNKPTIGVVGYVQPLFLWEGLINISGFLLLYVGVEFIKVRKVGDMSFGYILWYGVVRLCLEPLRAQSFAFPLTIIISSIWVAVGVLGILFNHLFATKVRRIKIWYTISGKIRMWDEAIGFKFRTKKLNKKINKAHNEEKMSLNEYKKQNALSKIKLAELEAKHQEILNVYQTQAFKNTFRRNDSEMLYYGGK